MTEKPKFDPKNPPKPVKITTGKSGAKVPSKTGSGITDRNLTFSGQPVITRGRTIENAKPVRPDSE